MSEERCQEVSVRQRLHCMCHSFAYSQTKDASRVCGSSTISAFTLMNFSPLQINAKWCCPGEGGKAHLDALLQSLSCIR